MTIRLDNRHNATQPAREAAMLTRARQHKSQSVGSNAAVGTATHYFYRVYTISSIVAMLIALIGWLLSGLFEAFAATIVAGGMVVAVRIGRWLQKRGHDVAGMLLFGAIVFVALLYITAVSPMVLTTVSIGCLMIFDFVISQVPRKYWFACAVAAVITVLGAMYFGLFSEGIFTNQSVIVRISILGGAVCAMIAATLLLMRLEDDRSKAREGMHQAIATLEQDVASRTRELQVERDRAVQDARYLSLFNQIAVGLVERRDRDNLMNAIIDGACTLLDVQNAEIRVANVAEQTMVQGHARGKFVNLHLPTWQNEGLVGAAWAARALQYIEDYPKWQGRQITGSNTWLRAVACAPMIVDDEVVGVLSAAGDEGRHFGEADLSNLSRLAQLGSVVLQNLGALETARREIAERKVAETVLQAERDFASTIVSTMSQPLMVLDLNGDFEYVNPAAEKVLGYASHELIGNPVARYVSPDDASVLAERKTRILNNKVASAQFTLRRKDGSHLTLLSTGVPRVHNGQVNGVIAVSEDISARLETETNLRDARDQALEASRIKSRFMATMSHEIRTPMNAILGLTELALAEPELPPALQDMLGTVFESGQDLNRLISEMLDFAKLEAGRLTLHPEPVQPGDLASKVIAMFEAQTRMRGVSMHLEIASEVPSTVLVDGLRLRQVLTNLVGNAVKFTNRGTVRVALSAQSGALLFEVIDTGIGISPEVQQILFEPFRQGDSSTTRAYGGTGLGLVICKSLVELMGGSIGARSVPGQGSTFWFMVPRDGSTGSA